jgi:hypothetical protein
MSMTRRMQIGAWAAAVLCFAFVVLAQVRIDTTRARDFRSGVMYLPNEKLLTHFTAGMSSVIADLLWLRCIQYTAAEAKGDRQFTWLKQMVETVTRLDPYFVDVYRFGSMFLASLKADDNGGLELLQRGIVQNPQSWQLPYEAAMMYLLNRRDQPGSETMAATYLAMSVATGHAPAGVTQLAARLQGEHNLVEIEAQMWTDMLRSDDKMLREMAVRKLEELKIKQACAILDQRIAQFTQTTGQAPKALEDLIPAGLLRALPPDPFGGKYFIDPQGHVRNTTLLDDQKNQRLGILRNGLDAYRKEKGNWPPALEDLLHDGILTALPSHPYTGQTWQYNAQTGAIE